jgi:hypothetical protein
LLEKCDAPVLNEVRSNVAEVQLAQVSSEPELIGVIAFRQTSCARSSVFDFDWLVVSCANLPRNTEAGENLSQQNLFILVSFLLKEA